MGSAYIYSKRWSDFVVFFTLLKKWSGSIFQLIWLDLLAYFGTYAIINVFYRFVMSNAQQKDFEEFVMYVRIQAQYVPLSFLLGFFVSHVLSKWWDVVCTVPWMATPAFIIPSYITTDDESQIETVRHFRRTMMRYMNAAIILGMRAICDPIQKRFACIKQNACQHAKRNLFKCCKQNKLQEPSIFDRLDSINQDEEVKNTFGYLFNQADIDAFENIARRNGKSYDLEAHIPLLWATRLCEKAHKAGFIDSNREYCKLVNMLDQCRGALGSLYYYDSLANHLVYTQVCVIAVYLYFALQLFANQYTEDSIFDLYFPVFSILEFVFYMGWFKIGYSLVNPLSGSPLDIDTSGVISYNLKISIEGGVAPDEMFPHWLGETAEPKKALYEGLMSAEMALPQMEQVESEGQVLEEEEKVVPDVIKLEEGEIIKRNSETEA